MFTRAEGKSPGDCCPLQTCDLNVSLFVQQDAEREGRKQMLYKRPGQLWGGVQTSGGTAGQPGEQSPCGGRLLREDVGFRIYCFPGQQLLLGREWIQIHGVCG